MEYIKKIGVLLVMFFAFPTLYSMKRESALHVLTSKKARVQEEAISLSLSTSGPVSVAEPAPQPPLESWFLPFECKYYGQDECDCTFTSPYEEWCHILEFHGIVAAIE